MVLVKGLEIRDTPMGFKALRLHYSADPEHDIAHPDPEVAQRAQAWLDRQRALYPDPNLWAQEMEISFWVSAGSRVFPTFRYEVHAIPLTLTQRKVVYRGWDFGWHCPVALLAQIDPQGRLLVLKEIVGHEQDTRSFAQTVLDKCAAWLPFHSAGYEDYCDPAGQQVKAIESERNERRDTEVLAGLGIHVQYEYGWSRKDGRALIHRLLQTRTDGTPSLYVDPQGCPTLAQAFVGRYVYPAKKDGTVDEEPDDKTHPWADVMASLRYLVIGLHKRLGLPRMALASSPLMNGRAPKAYHGYGTVRR